MSGGCNKRTVPSGTKNMVKTPAQAVSYNIQKLTNERDEARLKLLKTIPEMARLLAINNALFHICDALLDKEPLDIERYTRGEITPLDRAQLLDKVYAVGRAYEVIKKAQQ